MRIATRAEYAAACARIDGLVALAEDQSRLWTDTHRRLLSALWDAVEAYEDQRVFTDRMTL